MRDYIENNLQINEEILISPKIHWMVYLKIYLGLSVIGIYFLSPSINYDGNMIFEVLEKLIGVLLTAHLVNALLYNYSMEMAVTNKRSFRKTGIFKNHVRGFYNKDITAIKVRQSIIGKFFNCGTVVFYGKENSRFVFRKVYAPWWIKSQAEAIVIQCQEKQT